MTDTPLTRDDGFRHSSVTVAGYSLHVVEAGDPGR